MRKLLVFFLIIIAISANAERKKVGLVLGGGGAKGAAHIGVLKVLEEAEIPIDYIAGTSIGAIIGGLYSVGYDAETLDSLVRRLNWSYLLSNNVPRGYRSFRARDTEGKYVINFPYSFKKKPGIPAGLISGQNILNLFSGLTIGYHEMKSFKDLPIPFYCVATNLVSEDYVVLEKGSLPLSMRSSMSIPGVFMPVEMDSMVLVDGGVLNNFPTNVVKDMGAEIIIGVDLSTGKTPYSEMNTISGLINTLTDITGKYEYEKNKKGLNLYLNPDLKGFQTMDFNTAAMDSMYQRGVDVAQKHWDEIIALKKEIYGDTIPAKSADENQYRCYTPVDSLPLGTISITGVNPRTAQFIKDRIEIKEYTTITLKDINNAIAILDGMDIFSTVTYQLSDQTPYNLTFILAEQQLSHLNIGIRFDSEEMASILLNTTYYESFFQGSKGSITARLNLNPYLALNYEWRPNFSSKIGLSYKIGYEDFNLYKGRHKVDDIYYLWQSGTLKYGVLLKYVELEGGIEWNYFGESNELYKPDYSPISFPSQSFFNYFAKIGVNSLDNLYFPTKGIDANLKAELITSNFINYKGSSPLGIFSLHVKAPIKLHPKIYAIPTLDSRVIVGENVPTIYQNYAGGSMDGRYLPQQIAMPGVRNIQIFDNTLLLLKMGLRYNFLKSQYLSLNGGYAVTAKDLGLILDGKNTWITSARYSYSTSFGPIGGEINYSNRDKRINLYFNAGYYF